MNVGKRVNLTAGTAKEGRKTQQNVLPATSHMEEGKESLSQRQIMRRLLTQLITLQLAIFLSFSMKQTKLGTD